MNPRIKEVLLHIEEITGINTQGDTLDDAKENLADAINLMFQETRANFKKILSSKASGY